MRALGFGVSLLATACLALGVVACGASQAPATETVAKPKHETAVAPSQPLEVEPPLVELRTGAFPPEQGAPIELEPARKYQGPEFETLELHFKDVNGIIDRTTVVDIAGATYAFVVDAQNGEDRTLWIRRPRARANEAVSGDLFTK